MPLLGHASLRGNPIRCPGTTLSPQVLLVGIWRPVSHGQPVFKCFWETACGFDLGSPAGALFPRAVGQPGELAGLASGRGSDGIWGEQQMAQQTKQLIQPNYSNRCLKMFAFKFKLLGLLEEPTRMGKFGLPLN